MDSPLYKLCVVFAMLVWCFWTTECTGTIETNKQDSDTAGEASESYLFYQPAAYPRDCREILRGCPLLESSSVQIIKPDGYREPFEVYCDDDVSSSGWTVIQRRGDSTVNFSRSWEDYRNGFGFLSTNYWLGNHKLSYLTNQAVYELRVDMELSNGSSVYFTYDGFRINTEWDKFSLLFLGTFAHGGGGSLTYCPRNMIFGNCTCQGTCEEPGGSSGCYSNCTLGAEGCFCPDGFLMEGDECVPPSECSCFWSEIGWVIPNNQSAVDSGCIRRRSCTNNQLDNGEEYRCGDNAQCTTRDGVRKCYCDEGYDGDGQDCQPTELYKDCYDAYEAGQRHDGVYTILPTNWNGSPFNVPCFMRDGGGWTVFQRRTGNDRNTNFYRNWVDYRQGFGTFDGDFWLGNEKLHYMTGQRGYKLRVHIVTSVNTSLHAEYSSFGIAAESEKYRLSVSGYSGNACNGMDYADGQAFSTYDSDNDGCETHNCAAKHRGAWWYSDDFCSYRYSGHTDCSNFDFDDYNTACADSNLNGEYTGRNGQNIIWDFNCHCHLNAAEMKIRPST